jgi:hypothetical protein
MRFLDCSGNSKKPSRSILEVGVQMALQQSGFNRELFHVRGGIYYWSNRPENRLATPCQSSSTSFPDIEDLYSSRKG